MTTIPGGEGAKSPTWGGPAHDIAVDGSGQIVVTWVTGNGHTMQVTRDTNGTWSTPQVLVETFGGEHVSLAVDQAGAPQVIQRRGQAVYHVTGQRGVTKHYYAGGRRIASRVNGDLYSLLGDHLGSTTVVAEAQGNAVGHVLYDPYGEAITSTLSADVTDRLFTGYRWDDTIGLYDANARFYDPYLGQFTQPDSLVSDPMNPAAWNRFSYVYGNPVNLVDPSGHFPIWDALDVGFFLWSLSDFYNNPNWWTFGGLAVDTIGLLPIVPSVGAIQRGANLLGRGGDAAQFAAHTTNTTSHLLQAANEMHNLVGAATYADEFVEETGRAVIHRHRRSHFSIEVIQGTESLHTHQVIVFHESMTRIVKAAVSVDPNLG